MFKHGDSVRVKNLKPSEGPISITSGMLAECGSYHEVEGIYTNGFAAELGLTLIVLKGLPYFFIPEWLEKISPSEKYKHMMSVQWSKA